MKRLNFLETVGVITLGLPVAFAALVGVSVLTGYVKIYKETVV